MSVEVVAMLLGNTPAIVVKHYAPWIKSRQLALEAAVKTTWQSPAAIAQANDVEERASRSDEQESVAQILVAERTIRVSERGR